MADAPLAEVSADDLAASPQYQSLLADCREIWDSARRSAIEHMWRLGQRIDKALPANHEGRYGQGIILALERDGIGDRTKLWRAVQVYRTWDQASIFAKVASMLTCRKLEMLVALPDELRLQMEERIRSGELRTDDDVRRAIGLLKSDLGLLPPPSLPREQFLLDLDIDPRKPLQTTWNRSDPIKRVALLARLVPWLELDQIDRKDALAAGKALQGVIADYLKTLDEGAPHE